MCVFLKCRFYGGKTLYLRALTIDLFLLMKDWVRSYRWMVFPILFACFLVFDEVIDNMEGAQDASS